MCTMEVGIGHATFSVQLPAIKGHPLLEVQHRGLHEQPLPIKANEKQLKGNWTLLYQAIDKTHEHMYKVCAHNTPSHKEEKFVVSH